MDRTVLAGSSLGLLALAVAPAAQELPPGFVRDRFGTYEAPIALAFVDEDRLLVAEREGRVWFVDHGVKRNLVYDLTGAVQDARDRGLMGIAVGPDFDLGGWIHLLHVVRVPGLAAHGPTYSRLVRVRTEVRPDGDLVALPETREVLLGDSWTTGIPACYPQHSLGSLRFLSDGSLVLATGDNANGLDAGGMYPNCFGPDRTSPAEDIGAFRAQLLDSYDGKVLRVDPATGLGLPDNPHYAGDPDTARARVYAHGLRNPFRLTSVPVAGQRDALLVADVGWADWEEIDLCRGGEDFGWPCAEGPGITPNYPDLDTGGFCDGSSSAPLLTWHHSLPAAGFTGNCASALCVYRGERYPELYRGRLFFFDFERNWLRAAELGDDFHVRSTLVFGTRMSGAVELVAQPGTGDLVYVAGNGVFRIRYAGSGAPPVAVASATPSYGAGDLEVTLSAAGSSDPDELPLDYAWDLGDGSTASGALVTHLYPVYRAGAAYTARLTVVDAEGLTDSAEVRITPGNTPPRILELVSPLPGGAYVSGEPLPLVARAADDEDGLPHATWTLDLVHDHHVHPGWSTSTGLSTSVVPEVHGEGDHRFVVHLAVRDSSGLEDERVFEIYDPQAPPRPHLVALPLQRARVGQTLAPTGHVDHSYGIVASKHPTLVWDWGDGTRDVYPALEHQVDTRPTHVYAQPGDYELRLVATLDGREAGVARADVHVNPPRPAVALFCAIDAERWVSRAEQEALVAALSEALATRTSEVRAFRLGQGAELAAWMESLEADSIADVLVLVDAIPAPLVQNGIADSPLERWVERGNGLVWTGATPFEAVLADDGSAWQIALGADAFFQAATPFLAFGAGFQRPTALGRSVLPSLPAYTSERALRIDQLGSAWSVARLFAVDLDQDSDALELRRVGSRGFYAQFLCADLDGLPRAQVLAEYLVDKLDRARTGAPRVLRLGSSSRLPHDAGPR